MILFFIIASVASIINLIVVFPIVWEHGGFGITLGAVSAYVMAGGTFLYMANEMAKKEKRQ